MRETATLPIITAPCRKSGKVETGDDQDSKEAVCVCSEGGICCVDGRNQVVGFPEGRVRPTLTPATARRLPR